MKTILNFVEVAIRAPENKLSEDFMNEHVEVVKQYAIQLGKLYNADPELLSIAALLHDISAVLDIQTLPVHNVRSAEIAKTIMIQRGYKPGQIETVIKSIESHPVPLKETEGTIYEVILSNADAMALIARPQFWIFFATQIRKLNRETAFKWYRERVESNWNNILPVAQKFIEKEYNHAIAYIAQMQELYLEK